MKKRKIFINGLLVLILYFFLFPRPLGKELVLIPENIVALRPQDSRAAAPAEEMKGLSTGGMAGFLGPGAVPAFLTASPAGVVSSQWMVPFPPGPGGLEILDKGGRRLARLSGKGVPYARGERLFLYDAAAGRLQELNPSSGTLLWQRDFLSLVTVIDAKAEKTLVGLLDGRIYLFNKDGEEILEYRPGGSRIEAVYGGVLSSDGRYLALIAGLGPQRFIFLEEKNHGYRPVAHHDTQGDFRRAVRMSFLGEEGQVFYETPQGLAFFDLRQGSVSFISLNGRVLDWEYSTSSETLAMVAHAEERANFILLTRDRRLFFEAPLPFPRTSFDIWDDLFLLSWGRELMVLKRGKK